MSRSPHRTLRLTQGLDGANFKLTLCSECVGKLTAKAQDASAGGTGCVVDKDGQQRSISRTDHVGDGTNDAEVDALPSRSAKFLSPDCFDAAGRMFGNALDEILDAIVALVVCGSEDEDDVPAVTHVEGNMDVSEEGDTSPAADVMNGGEALGTINTARNSATYRRARSYSNASSRNCRNSSVNSVEDAYLSALHILHQVDARNRDEDSNMRSDGNDYIEALENDDDSARGADKEADLVVARCVEMPTSAAEVGTVILEQVGTTSRKPGADGVEMSIFAPASGEKNPTARGVGEEAATQKGLETDEGGAREETVQVVALNGSKRKSLHGRLAMVGAGVVGTVLVMTGRSRR